MISKCSLALTLTHLCACAVLLCLYKEKKSNFKIPESQKCLYTKSLRPCGGVWHGGYATLITNVEKRGLAEPNEESSYPEEK